MALGFLRSFGVFIMEKRRILRYSILALALGLALIWSLASAKGEGKRSFPSARYLVTAAWLKQHLKDPHLVVVDVRNDKDFDGRLVPGAVRMPWGQFRYNDSAHNIGGRFVGIERAQELLGKHGISRTDTVVLYDSVKKDGGATASYVFWVLDLLGHREMMLLERGIDGWADAGFEVAKEPKKAEPLLYQAPSGEIRLRAWAEGEFISKNLGDPYYRLLDARSREEYLGEKANKALDGSVLKPGHIPGAYNVDYRLNWKDTKTKGFKTYPELLGLYRGLEPKRAVIAYCHSARRGSFTYFVLRLMGFEDVILYERSWNEWGSERLFFPVELRENKLFGTLPVVSGKAGIRVKEAQGAGSRKELEQPKGGYVSCGG